MKKFTKRHKIPLFLKECFPNISSTIKQTCEEDEEESEAVKEDELEEEDDAEEPDHDHDQHV